MPTVTGPLHSDGASGSIGKQITFRKTRRGFAAVKKSQPGSVHATEPSDAQADVRRLNKQISDGWKTLTSWQKATWTQAADVLKMPATALFLKTNFPRVANDKELILWIPAPADHRFIVYTLKFTRGLDGTSQTHGYLYMPNWTEASTWTIQRKPSADPDSSYIETANGPVTEDYPVIADYEANPAYDTVRFLITWKDGITTMSEHDYHSTDPND